jgi:hypothetical protein
LSQLWSGLSPPDAATKSNAPLSANPAGKPLKIRGELSKQPGPALEAENARLRKAVSDLTLEKLILKEAASGNW